MTCLVTSLARARYLVSLALIFVIGLAGCFSGRSTRPLARGGTSVSPFLILPVLPGEVRITVDDEEKDLPGRLAVAETPNKSRGHLADLLNDVLDDLAGSGDFLVGPSRLRGAPTGQALERLIVYLDDPGPLDEAWKTRELAEISREIGAERIVRVRAHLHFARDTLFEVADPMTADWRGNVTVSAQLFSLDPPALLAHRVGEDRLWGKVGVAAAGGFPYAIAFPYGFGRSVGRSLDVAARQALTDLLSTVEEMR